MIHYRFNSPFIIIVRKFFHVIGLVLVSALFLFSGCYTVSITKKDKDQIYDRAPLLDPFKNRTHDTAGDEIVNLPDGGDFIPESGFDLHTDRFATTLSLTFVNPDTSQLKFYYNGFKTQMERFHELTDSLIVLEWNLWYFIVEDPDAPELSELVKYSPSAGSYAEDVGSEDAEGVISVIVMSNNEQEEYMINGFVKNISEYDIKKDILCSTGYSDFNYFYAQYDYNYIYLSYNGLTSSPNTLTHELGHFFFLPHDNESERNVMWPYSLNNIQQHFTEKQLQTMWNALPFRGCVINE